MKEKPKYKIVFSNWGTPIFQKKVFKIFPFRYYPQGYGGEFWAGWFKTAIEDYAWRDGRWLFMGISGYVNRLSN